MATIREDGSPRISGTEATFNDGELWLGSMLGSRKAADLLRDPRLALHSATVDETMAAGDAKLSGRAIEITDPAASQALLRAQQPEADEPTSPGSFHLFRVDVTELSVVRVGDPADHLVIESWSEHAGFRRTERH